MLRNFFKLSSGLNQTSKINQSRLISVYSSRFQATTHGDAHHHHHEQPKVDLIDVLCKRYPSQQPSAVKSRFEQLKRNHMQFLSLDINWNYYKPEQQTEFLRQLDGLIQNGYASWTADKKKALSLANVEQYFDKDLSTWDAVLSKNEELQRGDWKNMSLDEKKAAMYLAFGPHDVKDSQTQQIVLISLAFMVGTGIFYYALLKWFRSKKDLPNLSPEWKQAEKERFIKERRNPYTGESAPFFTKDGIKEIPE